MAGRPSFVLLTDEPVSTELSGASLRNHALADALSRFGQVSLIAVDDLSVPRQGRRTLEANRIAKALSDSILAEIEARIDQAAPDLVVVEGVALARIADRLIAAGHRVVLDMHNVESLLREEMDRGRRGWIAPLRYWRRWNMARQRESGLARSVHAVWTCSRADAEKITALAGPLPVHVVPNPIPAWCAGSEPVPATSGGAVSGPVRGASGVSSQ